MNDSYIINYFMMFVNSNINHDIELLSQVLEGDLEESSDSDIVKNNDVVDNHDTDYNGDGNVCDKDLILSNNGEREDDDIQRESSVTYDISNQTDNKEASYLKVEDSEPSDADTGRPVHRGGKGLMLNQVLMLILTF